MQIFEIVVYDKDERTVFYFANPADCLGMYKQTKTGDLERITQGSVDVSKGKLTFRVLYENEAESLQGKISKADGYKADPELMKAMEEFANRSPPGVPLFTIGARSYYPKELVEEIRKGTEIGIKFGKQIMRIKKSDNKIS